MLKKLQSIIKSTIKSSIKTTINNKKFHSTGIILAAFLVVIGADLFFHEHFTFVNTKLNDYFFRLRYTLWGPQTIDDVFIHIDLVDNDMDSLAPGPDLSSADRSVYTAILDILHDAGARMTGVDIIFDKETSAEVDEPLVLSTGNAGNVYYPVAFNWRKTQTQYYDPSISDFTIKPVINNKVVKRTGYSDNRFLYTPFSDLREKSRGLGHINCTTDPDGIIRSIPLIIAYDQPTGRYIPALGLAMLCDYLDVDPDTLIITFGKHILVKNALTPSGDRRDIKIPIDEEGRMRINWAAPWNKSFPQYSPKKLMLAGIEPSLETIINKNITNKIVMLSDISNRSKDQGMGVYNKIFPLSRIHTNVMNTILTQNFITDVTPLRQLILLFLLITALSLASYRLRSIPFMGIYLLIYGIYVLINFLGFVFFNQLGFLLVPSSAGVTAFIILSWYHMYRETKEKIIIHERSNVKTNFFINIAHETKTPLTLIINYLDKYIEETGMNENLAIIKQNIDKMARDMLNFMDAEALQMGKIVYNHDSIINICSFLRYKLLMFQEAYQKKDIELSHTIPDTAHFIKMNPVALDRILNNLLDNALKYTNEGGLVNVALSITHDNVKIDVSDTGIGIYDDENEKIFMPYYRIASNKMNVQGMGMGLYIINTIITRLHGFMTVKSTPGKGSTFTVTLPAYVAGPGDRIYDETAPSNLPLPLLTPEITHKDFEEDNYTVLIVEDNPQLLASIHNELIDDFNVLYGYNGEEALEKLKTEARPDIIVSDIFMDGMDGYTFYKQLLKDSKYHSIPFIFITAKSGPDEKIKALELGAVDFITKPFRIKELKAKISALIDLQVSKKLDFVDNLDEFKQDRMNKLFDQYHITPSERKVILQLLEGKQNKEIAVALNIKEPTVKYHLINIYRKCAVQNRGEVAYIFNK